MSRKNKTNKIYLLSGINITWGYIMRKEFDVIVVGSGIVGVTIAYYLKYMDKKKQILLIDKLPAAGQGDVAKSTGCFRNFYSENINYMLSDSTIDFYLYIQNHLKYDLDLRKMGYLYLLSAKAYRSVLSSLNKMRKKEVEMRIYESEILRRRLNMNVDLGDNEEAMMMHLENVDKGILARKAGRLSPDALVRFYGHNFRKLKGETLYNTKVTKLIVKSEPKLGIADEPFCWQDKKITGVVTNNGSFCARRIILSAGVWASTLLDPIGIWYYLKPGKREAFVVRAENSGLRNLLHVKGLNEENCLPIIIAGAGEHTSVKFFIAPDVKEKDFTILYPAHVGIKSELEEEPIPRQKHFYYGKLPMISKYFPQFYASKIASMWAGLHVHMPREEFYMMDKGNLLIVNVRSGICMGDSIGRVAAAWCLDKKYAKLSHGRQVKVSDLTANVRKEKW